jgi:hypothetical protein
LYEHRVQNYGPLLLVDPKAGMTARELAYFGEQRGEIHSGCVFGGSLALSATVDPRLAAVIAGPLGVTDASGAVLAPGTP